jgi:hypothetical protein
MAAPLLLAGVLQEPPITSFKKPITKPETKTLESSALRSLDIKAPTLNAEVAARHMGKDPHWLDYDSVALTVLMIAISILELLVFCI